jgi:inosose dehydratase
MPRFAIAPINWTNDDDPSLGGDITIDQCLTEMKEAGYEGCELGNKFPRDQQALADILRRYDLTLTTDWLGTNFTIDYDETIDYFRKRVKFLKPLGVHALKVCEVGRSIQQTATPIFSHSVRFDKDAWRLLLKGLKEAADIARDHDMYIAYHHHLGTGIEKLDDIHRLMDETDEKYLSLLPDTGHLFAASIDPLVIFQKYAARIKYVHLKDVRRDVMQNAAKNAMSFMDAVRAGVFTVPGDGCVDFAAIFAELANMKFSGWLVVEAEQDPKRAPPLHYAKMAREFLRKTFNQ